MDLKSLTSYLKTVDASGIEMIKVEPDQGKTLLKGMDPEQTVFLDDHIEDVGIEKTMIIRNVSQFLARTELFDLNHTKVTFQEKDDFYQGFELKWGNRKAVVHLGNPSLVRRFKFPEDNVVFESTIKTEQYKDIAQSIAAMKKGNNKISTINFSFTGNEVMLNIKDDNVGDLFQDLIDGDHGGSSERWSHQWSIGRFTALCREGIRLSNDDKCCDIKVTSKGIMFMYVNNLSFALSPIVQ